jgi:hypothetical protein
MTSFSAPSQAAARCFRDADQLPEETSQGFFTTNPSLQAVSFVSNAVLPCSDLFTVESRPRRTLRLDRRRVLNGISRGHLTVPQRRETVFLCGAAPAAAKDA